MTFSKLKVPFIIVLDQNQNFIIRCDKQFGCDWSYFNPYMIS